MGMTADLLAAKRGVNFEDAYTEYKKKVKSAQDECKNNGGDFLTSIPLINMNVINTKYPLY